MSYHLAHLLRAQAYADSNDISLLREDPFGYGIDGTVWRTSRHSVVKVLEHEKNFRDELECYQRLTQAGVDEISGLRFLDSLVSTQDNESLKLSL
jgi:hypothetical protein